jgi:hypothetical protein
MVDGKDGVVKQHAGAGKAHHLADLFTFIWFIAMHRALGAGGFFCTIATALDALLCVSFQA